MNEIYNSLKPEFILFIKMWDFFPSPPVLPLATGRTHYKGCKGSDSHSQGSFLWVSGMDIYTFTLYLSFRQLRYEAMIPNLPAFSSSLPLPAALPSVPTLRWHPQLHDTPVTEQAIENLTCYFSLFILSSTSPQTDTLRRHQWFWDWQDENFFSIFMSD